MTSSEDDIEKRRQSAAQLRGVSALFRQQAVQKLRQAQALDKIAVREEKEARRLESAEKPGIFAHFRQKFSQKP